MNLENYTAKQMVAVQAIKTGKFNFCCEATEEGKKACRAMLIEANQYLGGEYYRITFFTSYIKTPTIKW